VEQVSPTVGGEGDLQLGSLAGYLCLVMSPGLARGGRELLFSPGSDAIIGRVNLGLAEWYNSFAYASLSVLGSADVSIIQRDRRAVGLDATWLCRRRAQVHSIIVEHLLGVWNLVHRVEGEMEGWGRSLKMVLFVSAVFMMMVSLHFVGH
jgi:hypothetical protein